MKGLEESELVDFLVERIRLEKDIETHKERLALRSDFTLMKLFEEFDVE